MEIEMIAKANAMKVPTLLIVLLVSGLPSAALADNRTSCTKFADHGVSFFNGGFGD